MQAQRLVAALLGRRRLPFPSPLTGRGPFSASASARPPPELDADEDDLTRPIGAAPRRSGAPAAHDALETGAAAEAAAAASAAAAAAAAAAQFEQVRRLLATQAERLRRFDAFALAAAKRDVQAAARAAADAPPLDADVVSFGGGGGGGGTDLRAPPEPGLPVDYCIFCYHGTRRLLRHDNTALLSKFVSERGALLPKRFTKACAKHQRKLATTVKRARWLNLLPFIGKLHPRLRFTALKVVEGGVAGAAVAATVAP